MSHEIIIKKTEEGIFGIVPELGICIKASDINSAYKLADQKKEEVESNFRSFGLEHLLTKSGEHSQIHKLTHERKMFYITATSLIIFTMFISSFVIVTNIKKATTSLTRKFDSMNFDLNLANRSDERIEQDRLKVQMFMQKYRPVIEEVKKGFN
jgi:hypothetical protein